MPIVIICMNPSAAGASGLRKWKRIERVVRSIAPSHGTFLLDGRASIGRIIRCGLESGETQFVAAGGDGTVNTLLNELLSLATPEQRGRIQIGAIGLGSSNDFHKPYQPAGLINGIPSRVNFQDIGRRDVGCVSFRTDRGFLTRYFLVNASIGVTAESNRLFNDPGRILGLLKRAYTPAAIVFAALKTIYSYDNIRISVQRPGLPETDCELTYLALLKSPHVSGSFRFDGSIPLDNGLLRAYLCAGMTRVELLGMLWALSRGSFHPGGAPRGGATPKVQSCELPSIAVSSSRPFAVEFDGEVVTTRFAQFGVLPGYLQVCKS